MSFSIQVYKSTGALTRVPVLVPGTLTIEPSTWSAVAKGGMWDAEIAISGPLDELTGLTSWLGYMVEIINANGTPVWWGDIVTVEITAGGLRRGISLDRMANRIALRYAQKQPGGGTASVDTGWSDDTLSQAAYGIWERRITPERPLTANEATAMQATALATLASPHYTLAPDSGQQGATLYCTGYWQRTKRQYLTELRGLEQHIADGTPYPFGIGVTSSSIAFSRRAKCIAQLNGYFANIGNSYKVKVTGASNAGNNTTYTVTGTDDRDPVVYSSTAVTFAPADDITDANGGLAFIQNDDLFQITGSAGNSGTQIMSKAGSVHVEISGGYWGGSITSEAAGPTVNFYRGNQVTVTPTPAVNERASATITATVVGQKYYQTFTLSSNAGSWTVDTIEIRLQRFGGPVDNVQIELYTDNAGAPNTLLKSATVAADDIPLSMDWVAFNFDNAQVLAYGTTYGLVISRTGANDWDDYYMLDMDIAGGYSGGSCKVYDGASYLSAAADLIFRVLGGVDTGTQAQNVLEAESWPAVIAATSGVVSNQYRDGELRAYDELEALLDTGTSAGARLLANVTPSRGVIIASKPDKSTAAWAWQDNNRLTDLFGQDAEPGLLPAGEWVKLGNASNLGPWAALSPVFIERAEYDANSGWSLEPENAADPFDTGAVQG